ncbi:MAG TPA: YceI family protein [Gaiellaceae bacterium]|nr:YceI family protein [Gaiellaceae bacterium]
MTTVQNATALPTGTWQADTVHSSIGFAIRYTGTVNFKGEFGDFAATLDEGRLEGVAQVRSIEVDDENLAAHLLTADFFDADRFAELRFSSETVERTGDRVQIQGELTIKGTTKPVVIDGAVHGPATDAFGVERVGFELTTTVNRHDFGVSWNMPLPNGDPALADDVTINADLTLVRA